MIPPDSVIELAHTLTSYMYNSNVKLWSHDLMDEWIALYKSSSRIHIRRFYVVEEDAILLGTIALLDYAIKKRGCQPPIGFEEEQWVKDTNWSSKQEEAQPPLLKDMKVGDSIIWILGSGRGTSQRFTYFAIVERKNGITEKIRISEQEYKEYTSFYDSSKS